jgi:hypothetical protein
VLVVTRRLLAALFVAVMCSAVLASSAVLAQTSSGITKDTPEPTAVEPQAGKTAPVEPGVTTPAVETPPATTSGTPATAGGAIVVEGTVVTAGGVPGAGAADSGDDNSWLKVVAIALAALILFVVVVLVLWRWRGWDPRWLRRWRHASAEAGWRLSLGWAEFRDFVRIGR